MIASTPALDLSAMLWQVGGGLALFLYGMRKMTESLQTAVGGGMKAVLAKLTTNRFTGAIAGALITAVLQSSSVTTVLAVGFVSAGVMTFSQSIAVIMGANLGTTITAQIIAFKVTKLALPMIALGFLVELVARRQRVKHLGIMVMGLGMLFFGMELMSLATDPLRTHEPFIELMKQMSNPLKGILVGAAFTAMVQSSSATTGIVIVLSSQGFISLDAGIALVFGANLGTCATAVLAAIGKPVEAVRVAVVHIVFNVLGIAIWIFFIPWIADLVAWLSPVAADLEGTAKLAAETPRQIANAHTVFNLANTLVFIWFTAPLERLVRRLVPERRREKVVAHHLDRIYLETPAMAIDKAGQEVVRFGALVTDLVERSFEMAIAGTEEVFERVLEQERRIAALQGEILSYLGEISLQDLVEGQPLRVQQYLATATYLRNIADVIGLSILDAARARRSQDLALEAEEVDVLRRLHGVVLAELRQVVEALAKGDLKASEAVVKSTACKAAAARSGEVLAAALGRGGNDALARFTFGSQVMEGYQRVFTLSKRIARSVKGQPFGGDLTITLPRVPVEDPDDPGVA